MGTAYGIYPCGSALVMGKFDGETFFGELLIRFVTLVTEVSLISREPNLRFERISISRGFL